MCLLSSHQRKEARVNMEEKVNIIGVGQEVSMEVRVSMEAKASTEAKVSIAGVAQELNMEAKASMGGVAPGATTAVTAMQVVFTRTQLRYQKTTE